MYSKLNISADLFIVAGLKCCTQLTYVCDYIHNSSRSVSSDITQNQRHHISEGYEYRFYVRYKVGNQHIINHVQDS
jgi:hypothetical protein